MTAWTVILLAGLGSYLFRVSIVFAIDRLHAPAGMERMAGFVVPAAFAGLAAAALIEPLAARGGDGLAVGSAGIVTLALASRGRPPAAAFAGGLLTLWAVSALLAIN
ncbi:AzlD domain-containing protein [Acidimicrobiia bacterium EGI L10123]|uniref:AzlD domain-containing protein n=1 Tax=Salinilacustrithrix flava TaxID=2957203 RepID=UPI003D7C3665|nr:AzlD domain-containing protein [Acidimicrobiia bacterium EGI L10123]